MTVRSAIFKVCEAGWALAMIALLGLAACGGGGAGGSSGNNASNNPSGLIGGNLLGTSLSLSGVVSTFAGSSLNPGILDASGVSAQFYSPEGVTTDGTNLFVADSFNNSIRQITIASGVVSTLAGTGGATSGTGDGTGGVAQFNLPMGITTDGTNLYVSDTQNHTIRQIVIATQVVSTLAGTPAASGVADTASGVSASFDFPQGITTDGTNLYVADSGNCTIRKIVIATKVVSTLAGTAGACTKVDGTGAAARFSAPYGLTTDGVNLYVADTGNQAIRKIVIATGAVSTLATSATFADPKGICTDGINLYVTRSYDHTIHKIVLSSGAETTLAGTANVSGSTDSGVQPPLFYQPIGIATDGTSLYVADSGNNAIRKIQ
ncbi:MAG: hypothetical protein PHQ60_11320 [Sideroxydans sp.]|nr:hypothetical protein [Sideroxydans sp.]